MKRAGKTYINQHGFTMIEMVMVLIVLAIVTTVIAYRPTTDSNDLFAQAEILKSHLRYAQIKAMNDTFPWGIHISNAGSSYVLYKNNATATNDILPGEAPGISPAPQTHTFKGGVTVTSGVGTTINFNDWGFPGASTLIITLFDGTTTSTITITRNTGYIP